MSMVLTSVLPPKLWLLSGALETTASNSVSNLLFMFFTGVCSLLRNPDLLHDCVRSMVAAVGNTSIVSVKMRAGYEDTSLFEDNLLAAQEGGAAFVTVHPRTKQQGYEGRASWSLIARAKQLLQIPVVGNGDVVSVAAAKQLLQETGCQAIMVGRGAVQV